MKGLVIYMSIEKNENSMFLIFDEFITCLKTDLKREFNESLLRKLIDKGIIVAIKKENDIYISKDELKICKEIIRINYNVPEQEYIDVGYNETFFDERIKITKETFLCYSIEDSQKVVPVFIRNIIYMFTDKYRKCDRMEYDVLDVKIVTYNKFVALYIESAMYRKYRLDQIKRSNFANSSAYMGSKKSLVGFVIESMWPHVSDDSIILDIMCGSGAISNALAQISDVYASDAQVFCRLLAKIQGAGFNEKKAYEILNELYIKYSENFKALKEECQKQLKEEKEVFHMDMNNPDCVYEQYERYAESVKLYSSTEYTDEKIMYKIHLRKNNNKLFPYCLFTYYFSTIYFGLEQCMQIDSIRYAIDTIEEEEIKNWALGVLIVTVSSIASNHAGHFAQPKRVDEKTIVQIIEKRKKSAWLEFSKRLLAIAAESERYVYRVKLVEGPWEIALKYMEKLKVSNLVVYLDAPYKRDEYSRYYHVLETITLYDYPASEKKGRLRSKKNGERFRTEFFSKNVNVVENNLKNTIVSILNVARVCAWSYSDNGIASIPNIIDMVSNEVNVKVYIYSISHKHNSQRKKEKNQKGLSRKVMEYCIVFCRVCK